MPSGGVNSARNLTDLPTNLRDGHLELPERPGFGIVFDDDYVARHTVDTRVSSL